MQHIVKEIVDDLIQLDPEFAEMEEDLKKLVQKLIAAKPDVELDEAFKKRLQNDLRVQAEELKAKLADDPATTKSFNLFNMQKLAYTFAGATLAVLVMFTFQQFGGVEKIIMDVMEDDAATIEVKKMESQAFGSLMSEEVTNAAFGRGGGGGESAEMMADSMIAPEYTVNKFVYSGDLDLPLGMVEVLKRVKEDISTNSLMSALARFDFDLVDLTTLRNAKLQNFNIVEDREFGYIVMVDLAEGNISVNQNWDKWPDPYRSSNCSANSNCYEDLRLGKSDMLSESEVLRITAEFVQQMGINLDNYGEAKIIHNWREDLARFSDDDFYFPESISVTYPLKIKNQLVYNQGGTEEGINVSVDQRSKKVSSVWGIQTQSYQSSDYAAVADEALFRKFLEKGGLWGWMPEGATHIREIPLGDPELILMKHWRYIDGSESQISENQELIIPALRFPVLEAPEGAGYFYQKAVVIPLVEDILKEQERNVPTPEPMFSEESMKAGDTPEPEIGLANPASVKCEEDGYILEIVKDEEGNESGFCKNEEGKGCEEWEYFRGECEIPAVG